MLNQSFIRLHALRDLSLFQFRTGYGDTVIIQMRFIALRPGLYDLEIEQHHVSDIFYPSLITDQEAERLLYTVVQIIELYTERYPNRIIRLKGGTVLQATLFRIILRARHELLCPLFSIDKEGRPWFFPFRRNTGDSAFLLKRRADSELPSHPVRSCVNTRSRLFGNLVQVELHTEMNTGRPSLAAL